ncbi:MAG: DegT/DnrJ/EryC1/StrS family aminotransferase [Anaerolineales bacterium]|uniref:DegT/DnrJ/EryC1/StrS family aminotransferase n=1 Tax=Hydrogenophaga sp. TaxID=1904254 RepID=UPI0027317AF4|nr:DegT/DnrJ/EryC1/StrS family aminotransferase [Hydrogenophaga sp.]MDP2073007.1 DegT/DnrJ/EryC1/StrS family aminotransferase [Hydrogenophaga sp.]MDP2976009.1 DegT/DnrJ/EryC1/StrS family aminotransferase [Anaerolineales bacterium]
MARNTIPWASPHYWGNEERYVLDALKSSWISGGAYVDQLERDFARYCDSPHVAVTSNGTTALHLAFLALDLRAGDEVIVPGFGFMAAANVALNMGAKPVFSEVDRATWCTTAKDIERCLSPKTKAIVPIHTYGNVCDMKPIMELSADCGVTVVEDAAEAIGSKYNGQMAGTIAPLGVYSFHATKTITTGEGGAVATRSAEWLERMRLFRSHGMASRRYWHEVAGHNFRLTNMQAAIGCGQLEKVDLISAERHRVYSTYRRHLEDAPGISLQHYHDSVEPVVWAIAAELDAESFPQGRDGVMDQLKLMGIETRPGFYSADTMPHLYGAMELPVCSRLSQQVISFPSSPNLSDEEIEYVCHSLHTCRK